MIARMKRWISSLASRFAARLPDMSGRRARPAVPPPAPAAAPASSPPAGPPPGLRKPVPPPAPPVPDAEAPAPGEGHAPPASWADLNREREP